MRFSYITIISLSSLALSAPVKRSVLSGVIESTVPSNSEQIHLPCDHSTNTCQTAEEDTTHNAHDFEQHLGTQAGIITTSESNAINQGSYGQASALGDEVQQDGQALDKQMYGYPTNPDGSADRGAAPGSGRRRNLNKQRGEFGDQVQPILAGQAAAGQAVKGTTDSIADNNGNEGVVGVVQGQGEAVGGVSLFCLLFSFS